MIIKYTPQNQTLTIKVLSFGQSKSKDELSKLNRFLDERQTNLCSEQMKEMDYSLLMCKVLAQCLEGSIQIKAADENEPKVGLVTLCKLRLPLINQTSMSESERNRLINSRNDQTELL